MGQWVEITLEVAVTLSELHILGGDAKSTATLKTNARVKTLRVELDGKPAGKIQLNDAAQALDPSVADAAWLNDIHKNPGMAWPPHLGPISETPAKWFRFIIDAVYPGSKYSDTSMSLLAPSFPDPRLSHTVGLGQLAEILAPLPSLSCFTPSA